MPKALTINQLYKKLGKMIGEGHGKRYVAVAKDTFRSNLEVDGVTILPAQDCRIVTVFKADDDGGIAINKDGTEKSLTEAVLFGDGDDKSL